jgi:D-alanyl-D-alanine-carboxypeptidase/D-alanyl-D-alanine-endopeptidase
MPTTDSPPIRIRDLLHHTSGLVEDNPWGDRQQVLSEAAFSAIIAAGTDLASTPGTRFEYSNYGYALLGRIISNVSGQRYQDYIRNGILLPLGMRSTGYDVATSPAGSRAIGYRWQDNKWVREPDMADGAFGAMGGIETSAHDYARWMTFLLSAWPASNTPDTGPVRRASVRETIGLLSPGEPSERPGFGGAACRIDTGYGMGLFVFNDCELGRVARHTGGYPGYGSAMVLLPDAGVGMFTFNARTYFSNNATVMAALLRLRRAGAITDRSLPVAPGLANAYAHARTAWQSGSLNGIPLAMNVPLDEALPRRTAAIAALKQKLGTCDISSAIAPISAMEGRFQWSCAQGTLLGRVQRAPTATVELQVLEFTERK